MNALTLASTLHKSQIASTAPWHVLLTIYPNAGAGDFTTVLRLAREPQDVVYQGNTYVAFSFEFDAIWDKSSGELQSIRLTVGNVNRMMQGYLNQYAGGAGAKVEIWVVSDQDLAGPPAQNYVFQVTSSSADAQWVTLTLGATNPMLRPFTRFYYTANYCFWIYNDPTLQAAADPRGAPCGYTGALATCAHTLTDCKTHGNSLRFGGFPGLNAVTGFAAAAPV